MRAEGFKIPQKSTFEKRASHSILLQNSLSKRKTYAEGGEILTTSKHENNRGLRRREKKCGPDRCAQAKTVRPLG